MNNQKPTLKGRLIQHYRIESLLGEGGMGTVYQATDTLLQRLVAVKMLHPHLVSQTSFMERFRNEALILARLNHPNIAVVYNFLQDNADYFMAMEYVEGDSLEALIRKAGALSPAIAAEVVRQGLEGMAHAHRKGVLHRDIKPANLMLTPEGTIKLMDFGIARVSGEQRLTQANRIVGTLEYMAPELIEGQEPSPASDLYAMGVLLYELLSGKLPFASRTDYELMQAIVREKPIPLRKLDGQIPKELEAVVQKALDKNPAKRFADAKAFQKALQPFYASAPVLDPAQIMPPLPVTDVVDMQPNRKLAGAKKSESYFSGRFLAQHTPDWFRTNWEFLLAGTFTLVAVLFLGMLLLDRKPQPKPTTKIGDSGKKPSVQVKPVVSQVTSPTLVYAEPRENRVTIPEPTPDPVENKPKTSLPKKPDVTKPKTVPPKSVEETPVTPPKAEPIAPTTTEPVPEPVKRPVTRKSVAVRRLPVKLALSNDLSSSRAQEGETVRFRVIDAVVSEGEVVIQAGATAFGEVTRIRQAGNDLFRKKDLLEFRIYAVEAANGQRLALRSATISEEVKGKPVVFPAGQTFEVRTGDTVLTF
ncbi:serine/threonine-protein kinase [Larkinella punicea]|uniref:non-specific serine/threonine protein kinase n=1 Tax=Larkinella punicea TaxID=2315727 RepID=A0A368JNQ2_9BACT|nr:serine/threonine-protein kinase [Larkinella punicea]RCR68646.1 serine/threonine protein kinase [Larkinella punicea]